MFSASDQMMFQCPPSRPFPVEGKWKSNNNVEVAPNCPRCASPNTKFCYYNNYSLSQPRYFCKGCRRYWTKGGSLRNVPVGGGCRKYRRAKPSSAKVSQDQRVASVNYGENLNDPLVNTCSSNIDSMAQQVGATNGSDIDLAVVFAKFLNHDQPEFFGQEFTNEAHELGNVSTSSTPDGCQNDHAMVGGRNPSEKSNSLAGDPKQQAEEEAIQELIGIDMNTSGLQNLLSDEIVQDALWSEVATLPANVTWQPMVQLQDFDTFSVDDQPRISTSFMCDCNWNSLDFSGFEVFSGP